MCCVNCSKNTEYLYQILHSTTKQEHTDGLSWDVSNIRFHCFRIMFVCCIFMFYRIILIAVLSVFLFIMFYIGFNKYTIFYAIDSNGMLIVEIIFDYLYIPLNYDIVYYMCMFVFRSPLTVYLCTRLRNSSRVFGSSRKTPSMVDVTVLLLIFWTPRITMHMCLQNWASENGVCY